MPFFICGDLNEYPEDDAIRYANEYRPFRVKDLTASLPVTVHSYGGLGLRDMKLDYIFTDEKTAAAVRKVEIWDGMRNGIWLSDHFPVYAEFEFGGTE